VLSLRDAPHTAAGLAAAQAAVVANPEDAQARLALGAVLAARCDYKAALDALLAAAETDQALGRGPVRELMVKIFDVIGPRSPQAEEARNRLRSLLY
jgi:putative thioredoxin